MICANENVIDPSSNSLTFWTRLFENFNGPMAPFLFEQFADQLIKIIENLNLRIVDLENMSKNVSGLYEDFSVVKPENQADFDLLYGIVELVEGVFQNYRNYSFVSSLVPLIQQLVRLSQKHSYISAFYRLMTVFIKLVPVDNPV